jgi:hypothetical protein
MAATDRLMHYATSRKVAGSIPMRSSDFSVYLILLAATWTWGDLAPKRNECQEFSCS